MKAISGVNTGYVKTGIRPGDLNGKGFKSEIERLKMRENVAAHKEGIHEAEGVKVHELNAEVNRKQKSEDILKGIFRSIEDGQKRVDNLLRLSLSGVKFSQQELLTLQMRVYKFTHEIELISKLVEKGTSGVKQVVNTQV